MAGNFSDLRKFQENLNRLQRTQREELFEECIKELAQRFLAKVIKTTPVGDYSGGSYTCETADGKTIQHKGNKVSGKVGGTLRRGWTIGEIKKEGDTYKVEIINPIEYALT